MEELLNKLIDKGWKPYWIEKDDIEVCSYDKNRKKISIWYYDWSSPSKWDYDWLFLDLRQLTAKESWLWQFVCENKLVKTKDKKVRFRYEDLERTQNYFSRYWYEYRIIESTLCDEDKLEKFLLDNIKL